MNKFYKWSVGAVSVAFGLLVATSMFDSQKPPAAHEKNISQHPAIKEPCTSMSYTSEQSIIGETYHNARKALQSNGWVPLRTKDAGNLSDDPDIGHGNGPVFWALGYFELDACSGTGLAPCSFLFVNAEEKVLKVSTEGEELLKEGISARVVKTEISCTKADD